MRRCSTLLALVLLAAQPAFADPIRTDVSLQGGRRLSYLESGDAAKPVLILLHGKGGNAARSAPFAARLARDYHVYAIDFRGCGFSDWAGDGDYSVEASVGDLQQFVAAVGIRQAIVYGHSYGAVVGIAYAAKNPARTSMLILEDGGPTTLESGAGAPLNPGQAAAAGSPTPAPTLPVFASWTEMLEHERANPRGMPAALALESTYVRGADGRVRARNDVAGIWRSPRGEGFVHPWPLVRALAMPTLLVRAGRGLVPEAIAQDMVRANPRIRYVTIANAGHGVHDEYPDEVLAAVRAFATVPAALP
jgi:pimeloyl-ACP methyl ester carboxylesterase